MTDTPSNVAGADPRRVRNRYQFEFGDAVTPSVAVVEAVADATGRDIAAGPPLQEFISTDALNALLTATKNATESIVVSFDFDGARVTVDGTGSVTVE